MSKKEEEKKKERKLRKGEDVLLLLLMLKRIFFGGKRESVGTFHLLSFFCMDADMFGSENRNEGKNWSC